MGVGTAASYLRSEVRFARVDAHVQPCVPRLDLVDKRAFEVAPQDRGCAPKLCLEPEYPGSPLGQRAHDGLPMPLGSGSGCAPLGGFPNEDFEAAVRAVQLGLGRLGLHDIEGSIPGTDGQRKTKTRHEGKEMEEGSSGASSCLSSRSMSSSGDLAYKRKKKRRRLVRRTASESTMKGATIGRSRAVTTMRFKSRVGLLRNSVGEPGTMAALFLSVVRLALRTGPPSSTRNLLKEEVQRWAQEHSGLTERRDQLEIQTLILIMVKLGGGEYAPVADAAAQRAECLLQAKSAKGNWKKIQMIELLAAGGGIVPQSDSDLTGLGSA